MKTRHNSTIIADSNYPEAGAKFIYLVAGQRNIESVELHGGIFANCGETDRAIEDRLSDNDYGRKNSGGNWTILAKWKVPDWISDHDVHAILRTNDRISWGNPTNTEEFFFAGETDAIQLAKTIVESAVCCAIMNAARSISAGTKAEDIIPAIGRAPTSYTVAGFDAVSVKWRDIAAKETIWRKKAQANLDELKTLPSATDIAWRFLFSMLSGFVFVGLSLVIKPSLLVMLFVYCPAFSMAAITSEVLWLRKLIKKALVRAKDLG